MIVRLLTRRKKNLKKKPGVKTDEKEADSDKKGEENVWW
jgi:hypothetical protein